MVSISGIRQYHFQYLLTFGLQVMFDRTRTTRAWCFYEDVSWKPRLSKRSPFSSISNLAWIQSPSISVQGPPICSCRGLLYFCQAEFKHDGAARRAVFWPEPACRAAAAGRARRDLRGWYRRRRPRQPTSGSASTYRLRHNRKDSRIHTMSDLLGFLLVASDPLPVAWVCSAAEAATGTDTGSCAVVDPGAAGRAEAVRGRGGRRRGWRRWQQRQQWWRQRRLQRQRVKPRVGFVVCREPGRISLYVALPPSRPQPIGSRKQLEPRSRFAVHRGENFVS